MELTLRRFSDNGESTLGLLYLDNKFYCYTIEDEKRTVKIKGKTRIPEGTFEIKQRKVLSGMTEKYRSKFSWFEWHLELQNVPDFKYVYIHKGNTADHSDGCIILGDSPNNNRFNKEGFLGKSTPRFEHLYKILSSELSNGGKVEIKIESIE
tara:strand:- start:3933 stop:4388 length:456 start_codon:yes stop_codon:yes gene_type:complete